MFESKPRARQRLSTEPIIWLTTVDPSGRPQTSPVWFLVEDDGCLIYSLAGTSRVRNIEANPHVALNLDGDGRGGDIVTIEGTARVDDVAGPSNLNPAYQEKYAGMIADSGWTPEQFAADYPVPIRVTFVRGRAW